jgi:hypothetical protein
MKHSMFATTVLMLCVCMGAVHCLLRSCVEYVHGHVEDTAAYNIH